MDQIVISQSQAHNCELQQGISQEHWELYSDTLTKINELFDFIYRLGWMIDDTTSEGRIVEIYAYPESFIICDIIGNHDCTRIQSDLGNERDTTTLPTITIPPNDLIA